MKQFSNEMEKKDNKARIIFFTGKELTPTFDNQKKQDYDIWVCSRKSCEIVFRVPEYTFRLIIQNSLLPSFMFTDWIMNIFQDVEEISFLQKPH